MRVVTDHEVSQGLYLSHNTSQRFESRFSTVRINQTPSIMFKGMEGSVLGVWVAHGEGKRCYCAVGVLVKGCDAVLIPVLFVQGAWCFRMKIFSLDYKWST